MHLGGLFLLIGGTHIYWLVRDLLLYYDEQLGIQSVFFNAPLEVLIRMRQNVIAGILCLWLATIFAFAYVR